LRVTSERGSIKEPIGASDVSLDISSKHIEHSEIYKRERMVLSGGALKPRNRPLRFSFTELTNEQAHAKAGLCLRVSGVGGAKQELANLIPLLRGCVHYR
jgi:hypothetical protein